LHHKEIAHKQKVVGDDDLPIAMHNNPRLTTIRQSFPLAGRLLAQNLRG
jgi:DNA-binding LacI/PurR family transcriptional regulator